MATRTTLGASLLPVRMPAERKSSNPDMGGGAKKGNSSRGRRLSLVETNIRNGSKSSVSSFTEESDATGATKKAIKSVASGDGAKPPKVKRIPVNSKEAEDKRSDNKENRAPRVEKFPTKPKIEVVEIPDGEVYENQFPLPQEETVILPPGVINIDIEDGLYEYSRELTVYLKELEKRFVLEPEYMAESSVTSSMRGMLVDWLIQVQHHLNLCQETLYIAISILDTILSKRDINSEKLQLVGVTAILLASKLEEYYPADIAKLVHLTSDSYTVKQILRMERVLLEVLDFQIYFPEVMSFLRRYVRAALRDQDNIFLETCQYLVDNSLVLSSFSTIPPSKQAAASVLATNCLFAAGANQSVSLHEVWSPSLEHYTGYQLHQVSHLAVTMLSGVIKPLYEGAYSKYKSNTRHKRLVLLYHLMAETVEKARSGLEQA